MFFVIWHGVHGYDRPASNPDNAVMVPTAADSLSPYDNQKIIDANPQNPQYGAEHAMHHWGEPYLGYYVANDEWVIRKHAQMLSDAGVDMIMFDVTNQAIYLPVVKQICDVYTKMRKEGNKTPQISFIFNTNAKETLENLFDSFYGKNLYKELWFRWKGKPLIFCPPEGITPDMAGFFHRASFVVLLGMGLVRRRTRQMPVGGYLSAEIRLARPSRQTRDDRGIARDAPDRYERHETGGTQLS